MRAPLRALFDLPHGIVLVTGPTGSGKTTTLYAMLNEANKEDTKVSTGEDPVEYDLEGIIQIPVNEDIGVTYASVLRAFLRENPDEILVGGIRDKASDIHLEPFEGDFKIRYRVDGSLFELEAPPPHLAEALIARAQVMSDLDIAETRLPQDGRIALTVGGRSVDLRVSTLTTMYGE